MEFTETFSLIDDHASIAQTPFRLFLAETLRKEFRHTAYSRFSTDTKASDIATKLGWRHTGSHRSDGGLNDILLYETDTKQIITIGQYDREIGIWAASNTSNEARSIIEAFSELCEPIQLDKPGVVPIKFWVLAPNGPSPVLRDIAVAPWHTIEANYSTDARHGITAMTNYRPPIDNGNLLLWHGPPGTGKTHAIRSLADAWMPWCDIHYIMDPEEFFGHPFYMSNVLLDEKSNYRYPKGMTKDGFTLDGINRWKLLIIEDADELINDDARRRSGQNLSRLLNLGDGIVGQGLKTLTLITTNEPIDHIHPAVGRRGRCAAKIHFDALDHRQANDWLNNNGVDGKPVTGPMTLADLYELKRTNQQINVSQGEFRSGMYI